MCVGTFGIVHNAIFPIAPHFYVCRHIWHCAQCHFQERAEVRIYKHSLGIHCSHMEWGPKFFKSGTWKGYIWKITRKEPINWNEYFKDRTHFQWGTIIPCYKKNEFTNLLWGTPVSSLATPPLMCLSLTSCCLLEQVVHVRASLHYQHVLLLTMFFK